MKGTTNICECTVDTVSVCVLVRLPECDGCPCVCAGRRSWTSLTCCDSHRLTTLNTQCEHLTAALLTHDLQTKQLPKGLLNLDIYIV